MADTKLHVPVEYRCYTGHTRVPLCCVAFPFSVKPRARFVAHVQLQTMVSHANGVCRPFFLFGVSLLTPFKFGVCTGPPFRKCTSSTEPEDIENWEMTRITDMDALLAFYEYVKPKISLCSPAQRTLHQWLPHFHKGCLFC